MPADESNRSNGSEAATATGELGIDPSTIDDDQLDALAALGHRQRLEILFALADRERDVRDDQHAMSFTALYEAVDIESSSQFSYHLDRLVGPFVAETDDGYHLTYGGGKLVRAVRSGLFETATALDPIEIDGTCVACETGALEALLRDERFVVRCRGCEATLLTDTFPRSQAVGRSPDEVVESFGYRIWSAYVLLRGDTCPECYAPVERRVEAHDGALYTFAGACDHCGFEAHFPIEVPVVFHPVAAAHLWRAGVSVLDCPLWELFELFVSDDWTTDVASVSPLDARFRLSLGEESLELRMSDDLAVEIAPSPSP